ncbi:hypothetical protein ACFV0R_25470 [Streptomyces sp. NPDC059578]|uniref:hypothetical protein n=1 Tax=Streptomyces sp. NPDC059578 TaxID=3346874 RepID=UPI0036A94C75
MSVFLTWKRYAQAVDQEISRAGFPGASHSVVQGKPHHEFCTASWLWPVSSPLLNSEEWPAGLALTWSSEPGGWTCTVLDEYGLENTLALPVPALAAPSAITALLPALMDGRYGLLPASEERWEFAWIAETSAASAHGADKYGPDYQVSEEQAEDFLRWQGQLEGTEGAAADDESAESDPSPSAGKLTFEQRLAVRKKLWGQAAGLTRDLVHGLLAEAGGLKKRPDVRSVADRLAAARRNELRRIWNLMAEQNTDHYDPEQDPGVRRWRDEERRRQNGPAEQAHFHYRVVAQRTDDSHPGAVTTTNHTVARSVEEAVAAVRRVNERDPGLYGTKGLYRVVEVSEEILETGERVHEPDADELARQRHLGTVMNAALAHSGLEGPVTVPPETLKALCDFFTRAIVFPGQLDPDDGRFHTSDPGRDLARLLLEHLENHGLVLKDEEGEQR